MFFHEVSALSGAIGPSGQAEFVANDFRIWKKYKSFLPLHI
jgi:hypothetical protein